MRKIYTIIVLLIILSVSNTIKSQQVIVTDDATYTTPANGAALDIKSTTKGLIIPRMTTAQRTTLGGTTPANGVVVYDTTLKSFWYWDTDIWMQIAASNLNLTNVRFGDATNYSQFEADGTLLLHGTATTWTDLLINPALASSNGNNKPVWSKFVETNIFTWAFADAAVNEITFTVQLPHNYKEGSTIYPHVHWSSTTDPGTTRVKWVLEYQWVNHQTSFTATTTSTESGFQIAGVTGRSVNAYEHIITPISSAGLVGTGKSISSLLICRLYRDGSAADDTFTGTAFLLSADFHFEIDSFGSRGQFTKDSE